MKNMQNLQIRTIPLGPLETNCHIVWTAEDCWVFDAGWTSPKLMEFLKSQGLAPSKVLVTHGHGDHIGGIESLIHEYPDTKIISPAGDAHMLTDARANLSAGLMLNIVAPQADILVNPGDVLQMGSLEWKVLDVSGHTLGGVAYYCQAEGVVVVGDALFSGSVGRTDIPNGSHEKLIANIMANLMTLPDDTRVLCGHGPDTTIGKEKRTNYFLVH